MMTHFPPVPRDASRAWIQTQLTIAFPENAASEPERLAEYGDSLFAIAELNNIPAETLLWWIHHRPQNKDFSLASWRLWCARYADAAARLPEAALVLPETPQAREPAILCVRCYARLVQRIDKLWWCSVCGEIQI
jgi:hypothetical protein